MEPDHNPDGATERSYLTRDTDFIKDHGAGELGLKNASDDIRVKATHIESLGLGIMGTVQLVSYGTWEGKPACLTILQFNHRGTTSASAFRRIEILVSCEPWISQSLDRQPVLRNFSPRRQLVRLDHDRGIWGWDALQRSWASNESTSDPALVNLTQSAPSISGSAWSNRRRMKLHQISWIIDSGNKEQWQVPDRLRFAFVVQYYSTFKATIEINAKTRLGLPFPLIALPWSKDDPLLFNGKTQIGRFAYTPSFDQLLDIHWAKLAPYLPEWDEVVRGKQTTSGESAQQPESHQKVSDRDFVYRVRRVPMHYERSDLSRLLGQVLLVENEEIIKVWSLTTSPYRSEKIATVTFDQIPGLLMKDAERGKNEWQFEAKDLLKEAHYMERTSYTETPPIAIDTNFLGFTPLHLAEVPESDCNVDIIAVTGLGGHAFGSWKSRGGSHMWLRDSLAFDLPGIRILVYGFDSHLGKSDSFQSISSIADQFQDSLRAIRSKDPRRPIIFIGHSLGGLIIKQALLSKAHDNCTDSDIVKATYAILFFGVPSQGMNIESIIPMVGDQPNRALVESLSKVSETLITQQAAFVQVFPLNGSELICFYETRQSPTAERKDASKWTMTGEPAVLVDPFSATHGSTVGFGLPMHRTHSDLVKFAAQDEDYERVDKDESRNS
ncbi:hypothetical protein G7Y79_00002g007530 [Physcia stellaris]|nr:hypothetical protein G7Y79_00002g007530 [Physcia stellaris]